MNRRTFLATAGVALDAARTRAARAQAAPANVPARRVYSLNRNWLYSAASRPPGAEAPEFNDAGFTRVTLPHTNIDLPWHSFDDKAYEFVSMYRRHFQAPAAWRGKRVFVDFAGAMTASKVTFNGHAFERVSRRVHAVFLRADAAPEIRRGPTCWPWKLDSTERADIPPFGRSIDYLTFGGIYRDVELRVVPETHL